MGIYTNQANRVMDHVRKATGFTDDVLETNFSLSVDRFENSIIEGVKTTGLNGKQVADHIISLLNPQDYQEFENKE